MKLKKELINKYLLVFGIAVIGNQALAQQNFKAGSVSGNFKLEAQSYIPDSTIGADTVDEKMLSNSYMNIIYTNGDFTAGVRFEGYFNTMQGYDQPYDGFGLANRYATYRGDIIEITGGNFYEQFGNGLVFRSYEDRDLGYDNAMDGARIKLKPAKGVVLTGIIGNQRLYWEKGEGIVRGFDADIAMNELIPAFAESNHRVTIGGSFVSKYQKDEDPLYILPENVAAGACRVNYSINGFSLASEYANKSQDPSFDNNHIFKTGSAFLLNANYSKKGIGAMLQYKWVDNMSFRSVRDETINNVLINNLPAISKNHSYAFAAMYPYATQVNGEAGLQAEFFYKFKKNSMLGGNYGTLISANYTRVVDIKREAIDSTTAVFSSATDGYKTSFLSMTDSLIYRDFNVEISKKISKKIKGIFTYQNIAYNQKILAGHLKMVNTHTFIADVTFKLKPKHSLRIEAQALFTGKEKDTADNNYRQDYGNWAMLLLEYTISPNWFFSLSDQFNYISLDKIEAQNTLLINYEKSNLQRNHYFSIAMGYTKGATRVALSYGKQREGILCVGGVCRSVPAAYGALISISHTF